jgi:hypothetical protein
MEYGSTNLYLLKLGREGTPFIRRGGDATNPVKGRLRHVTLAFRMGTSDRRFHG